jgi:2-iminoacetate synthase ThiH
MKIQSLSVVVPAKKCVNNCPFCVSKMHNEDYENMMYSGNLYYNLYEKDFIRRLDFARDNGCNTVMLTGDCEPLQT